MNGFTSNKRSKSVYVWMYRKDGTEIEVNTENVGVERDFYGGDQDSSLYGPHQKLDDRITELVNRSGHSVT